MRVFAIATATPTRLDELELYVSKPKAMTKMAEGDTLVELHVDEYPAFSELTEWLHTLTTEENLPGVMQALQRAETHGLGYEVMFSAYMRQDEQDFEIVDALHEACYRWDV
jgi:hypothetical protein